MTSEVDTGLPLFKCKGKHQAEKAKQQGGWEGGKEEGRTEWRTMDGGGGVGNDW